MNLGMDNFLLILSMEAIAVCLFAIAILALKNRKLRRLLTKLQKRIKELRAQAASAPPPPPPPAEPQISYSEYLDQHLEHTKSHHYDLGSRQDIALDLDPDAPLPRRAAAIRHALLIAEKEATAEEGATNWDVLAARYQQLLSYTEDYSEPTDNSAEDLEQTREELTQARKRINNLERFKTMYLELEEKWEKCKGEATEHYTELKSMAEQTNQGENFQSILENYHSVYNEVGVIIEKSSDAGVEIIPQEKGSDKNYVELQRLRMVAADQHKIITDLKEQLDNAETPEEQIEIVEGLQTELQKQARFIQESETCIQLMEDELEAANRELSSLRNKSSKIPEMKTIIKELTHAAQSSDQMVDSLKVENRRLAKKLKLTQEAPPEDNEELIRVRKELSNMQSKYNELEEKFLDLKLKE